ncbi:MAG: cell envelope biosis protein OmpA, partial [Pseudomonadota bacterium]
MVRQIAKWVFDVLRVNGAVAAVGVLGAVATFTLSPSASAQDSGAFYLDRAQLSGAPDDPFMTWRPKLHDKARFFGAATLGYSLNPLRISTLTENQQLVNSNDNPFSNQVLVYLNGGVQFNRRVGMDLQLPIALINDGGADPQGSLGEGVGGGISRGTALYDLRLSLRLLGVESDSKKFRWGGGGSLFVPTGNAVRFSSDGDTNVWIYTNAEYDFGDFLWVGMLGPHFRTQQGPSPSVLQVGNELRLSTGLFLPLRDGRITLGGEVWGQTGIGSVDNTEANKTESSFFRGKNTQFEWLGQAKLAMGEKKTWYVQGGAGTRFAAGYGAADIRVLAQIGSYLMLNDGEPKNTARNRKPVDQVDLGADPDTDGDGFPDSIDQCPTIKEDGKPPIPDDGCPDLDRDDDGIPDAKDKCPDVPEDKDGVEDEDGCPEDDADGDGILDKDDACPIVKGIKHEDPKKHGCPPEKKSK